MIIIVEGIDRVGKTILCNKLSKKFNIPIHKYNGVIPYYRMKNNEETDKMLSLIQLLKETNSNIIFDRFHFTDYVYGIIERDYYKNEANWYFNLVEHELNKYDTRLILVHPINVEESSFEHGSDLTEHYLLFKKKFKESSILKRYETNYNEINTLVDTFEISERAK